jgi:hypothetical protein
VALFIFNGFQGQRNTVAGPISVEVYLMCFIKSIFRTSLLATAVALVSGCAGTGTGANIKGVPSVDPASTIQINGSYDIPVNKARVYFQNGAQIAVGDIKDRWNTYCSLLVQDLQSADQPQQTIMPGRFEIVEVMETDDWTNTRQVFVASLIWVSQRPARIIYKVDMRLHSAEQPNVRSLICEKTANTRGKNHPTSSEIQTALGSLIEINMPQ